jgi:DNA-binding NarL/FixJ family response regulator
MLAPRIKRDPLSNNRSEICHSPKILGGLYIERRTATGILRNVVFIFALVNKRPTIRILVVDDHDTVRRLICSVLQADSTMEVTGQAASGEDAVTKASELKPDIVLLDITLPGISGIQAAQQLLSVSPKSQIIFLSQHHSVQIAREALKAGGRAYVTKSDAGRELLHAIGAVIQGKLFVSRGMRELGLTLQPTTLV